VLVQLTLVRWKSVFAAVALSAAATVFVQSSALALAHTSVLAILVFSPGLFLCGLFGVQSTWALYAVSFVVNFAYYFALLALVRLWFTKSEPQ
jgi:hypothetical protein